MRRQLAITVGATTSLVLIAFLVPLALLVRSEAVTRAQSAAQDDAETMVQIVATVGDRAQLALATDRIAAGNPRAVTVFMPDSTVLGAPARADRSVVLAAAGRSFTATVGGGRAVLAPVRLATGGTAVVRVLVPNRLLREGVARAVTILVILGLLLLATALVVADRLARGFVGPMEQLGTAAHQLAAGKLDARVEPAGSPEVAEVGHALNRLAGRILELLAAERERIADLSHRLRTPLTALRLDAEALPAPFAERLAADVDAVERTVDMVIRSARRGAAEAVPARADLAAVAEERVEFWRPLAEDQGRGVSLSRPPEPCPVPVAAGELAAALDALLENVFAHTSEGTAFSVRVERRPDGVTRLLVQDDGPGLPANEVVVRGASAIGSTGLGLDIARRTAEAGGGALQVLPSTGGAAIALDFGSAR